MKIRKSKIQASVVMHSGTSEEMLQAFEDTLQNTTASTDINAADDITDDVDIVEDIDINEYVDPLMGELGQSLSDSDEVDNWNWRIDDNVDSVYVLVSKTDGRVDEYEIPFVDLSGDIQTDVTKLMTAMQLAIKADPAVAADDWDDDIYSSTSITAHRDDNYFGEVKSKEFGQLISDNLKGQTVSKRRDLAEEPGGLVYEANKLGIDMWDLLEALEGMCRDGRATEIDDSIYKIIGGKPHPVRSLFGSSNSNQISARHLAVGDVISDEVGDPATVKSIRKDAAGMYEVTVDINGQKDNWYLDKDDVFTKVDASSNIVSSYSPALLDDLIQEYQEYDLDIAYDLVMEKFNDEDLANDVVDGVEAMQKELGIRASSEYRSNSSSTSKTVEILPGDDEIVYVDSEGGFGLPGDEITLEQMKEYWNAEHDYDECLAEYNDFDAWFEDTRENYLTSIPGCSSVTASYDPVYEDIGGNMFGEGGVRYSLSEIQHYWDEEKDSDPSLMDFESFEDWFQNCLDYGCIKEVDDEIDAYNITSATDTDKDQIFMLMEYSSDPECGIDGDDFYCYGKFFAKDKADAERQLEAAKLANPNFFKHSSKYADTYVDDYNEYFDDGEEVYQNITAITEQYDADNEYLDDLPFAATNIEDKDLVLGDNNGFEYILTHGWGPGTLPKDVEVIEHTEDGYKDIVILNRKLTKAELDEYDIKPGRVSVNIMSNDYADFADAERNKWVKLKSKQVNDYDGFLTEYTLYESNSDENEYKYICMFGDSDIYYPDETYADWSGDSLDEAEEWFDNYTTDEE